MAKVSEELLKKLGLRSQESRSPGSTHQLSLPPSLALLAPTFPTFTALATLQEDQQTPRPSGLYVSLLDDPKVLLQDLLSNPAKYEPGVAELLQDLVAGRREHGALSTQQSELLDRAVIDFTQPNRRREVVPPPVVKPKPAPKVSEPLVEAPEPTPAPILSGMEPFWWLK